MKKRFLIILAVFAVAATVMPTAHAVAQSPTAHLRSANEKLEKLAVDTKKNEKKILSIVNALMDFQDICKSSLGKHWDARSESEQREFVDTLHSLIEENLINNMENNKDHQISYTAETTEGQQATVVTVLKMGEGPRAEETEIAYKMKMKGKSWVVVDMITDGVSLVDNYRSQFNKIINEDGWDTLMQKMKDKLTEQK